MDANHTPPSDPWRCGSCGDLHSGLVYAIAYEAPDMWAALPGWKRALRSHLTGETCVITGEQFFIRGLIEIPVRDAGESVFAWNVWSSLSKVSFADAVARWDDPDRVHHEPYFGWMSVELAPAYPTTTNLKLHVHSRELGRRPFLEVEPTDHPLAVEQREGITLDRVRAINELLLHPHDTRKLT